VRSAVSITPFTPNPGEIKMASLFTSITQLIEKDIPITDLFIPIIHEALVEVEAALVNVHSTPPISVKIGGHTYSVSLVLNKVS
jgi:hypothetical protein